MLFVYLFCFFLLFFFSPSYFCICISESTILRILFFHGPDLVSRSRVRIQYLEVVESGGLLLILLWTNYKPKYELVFVLTLQKTYSQRFGFKASTNAMGSIPENSLWFKRSAWFCVTINWYFPHFQYLKSKRSFLKNKNLF